MVLCVAVAGGCGGDDLVLPEDGIPSSIAVLSGNNQNGIVGTPLTDSVVVRVLDVQGRPVQGQQVTFSVLTGNGDVSPGTVTTNADGHAAVEWTLGSTAGQQQLRAEATGGAAPDDLATLVIATAGASTASTLELISGDDQNATAGSTLEDSLLVRVTDAVGNPVAGVTVLWTTTGGATASAGQTATGLDGRTGVRLTLGTVAGDQSASAAAAGLSGSPVTFSATATVGSAGKLVITQQPSATAVSGSVFARQPRVAVQDAAGNAVPGAGRAVTAELASGPAGGILTGTATVPTNFAGVASFTNLGITGPAGQYSVNFSSADLTGATSSSITVNVGAAAKLAFTVSPSNTTAGAAISPAVRVAVQDALGQTVTSATNAVTLSIGTNPGGATLAGTTTVNAVNGVATFSNLRIDNVGSGYTLTATASGLTSTTSGAFDVTTGAASAISAANSVPAQTTAGATVSPAPAVRVVDVAGNPVAGIPVTFELVNGGNVSGGSQTTNALGIATVGSWSIGPSAGTTYQLRAVSAGLTGSPVTFSTLAVAGSAGQLTIEVQPGSAAQSGQALDPQPSLQLRDNAGNPVAQSGVAVTATIASGPSGATLTNATRSTNSSGVATFVGLTLTGPSGVYTLNFAATNVTAVESGAITVGSGAATRLVIVAQPSSTVQNGEVFPEQPAVQLQDAAGNPVGQAGVTITATLQDGDGAVLGGDRTVQTNSSGVATYVDLRITGDLQPRVILFAASGLTGVASGSITVVPGPISASASSVDASPTTIVAGDAGSTITVTVRDASGNPISGALVDPESEGEAGGFAPASATTDASGQAVFTYTSIEPGSKTIRATADGILISESASITVQPAP